MASAAGPRKAKPTKKARDDAATLDRLLAEQQRTNDLLERIVETLDAPIAVEVMRPPQQH